MVRQSFQKFRKMLNFRNVNHSTKSQCNRMEIPGKKCSKIWVYLASLSSFPELLKNALPCSAANFPKIQTGILLHRNSHSCSSSVFVKVFFISVCCYLEGKEKSIYTGTYLLIRYICLNLSLVPLRTTRQVKYSTTTAAKTWPLPLAVSTPPLGTAPPLRIIYCTDTNRSDALQQPRAWHASLNFNRCFVACRGVYAAHISRD